MASSNRELKLFSNAQVVQAWMSNSFYPPQSPVPTLRSNKRKRGVLQPLHPNMASKDSYLPPSTPNLKGAAKKKSKHEKHSDIAEIGAETGEEEKTPQPRRTRGSRSSARTQKDAPGIPHDVMNEQYNQTSLVLGTEHLSRHYNQHTFLPWRKRSLSHRHLNPTHFPRPVVRMQGHAARSSRWQTYIFQTNRFAMYLLDA